MLRRQLTAMAVVVTFCAVPAQAQLMLNVSGGATIPLGDYDKYSSTGWIGTLGLNKSVGSKGLSLGGHLYYGDNPYADLDEGKTTLSGILGSLRWRFGDGAKPGVFLVGNVGYMKAKFSSGDAPNLETSEDGVAYGAGAGIEVPKGSMRWWLLARYLSASVGEANIDLAPLTLGVSFPLGK